MIQGELESGLEDGPATELKPLYLRLRDLILGSVKIAVDETVAPVLDPGRGCTKKGYFWAIARDDRPWGGSDPSAVAYTYAPGRGAVHALKLLESYTRQPDQPHPCAQTAPAS